MWKVVHVFKVQRFNWGKCVFKSIDIRLVVLATVAAASVACSKTEYVYQTTGGNQGQSNQDYINIPSGVWMDGVNDINYYPTLDGLVIRAGDSSGKNVSIGGFNGTGTGNKAFLGLMEYSGKLVSEIESIEVEARQDRNSPASYLNLLIDCDGDGTWTSGTDAIVVVDSDVNSLPTQTFEFGSTFRRISFSATDSAFKAVDARCGMPAQFESTRAPLSQLPPTARLINASTGDLGMPRATVMPAIMLVMNTSSEKALKQMTVREIKVNDKSFRFVQD